MAGEGLDGFRSFQGAKVLWGPAPQPVPHSEFYPFTRTGSGNGLHGQDSVRAMPGARLGAQGMADLLFESCVEGDARSRDHKKNKLEVIARRAIDLRMQNDGPGRCHYQSKRWGWENHH